MKLRYFCFSCLMAAFALMAHADERKGCVTVAVFSVNDFHGAFLQDADKDIPGAPWLVQTLDSLKEAYPYHLTVSAGDNFGGSYFYSATRSHSLMPMLMSDMGITLSAVGNHEFDEGQDKLAAKWNDVELRPRSWQMRYVCANVRRTEGGQPDFISPYVVDTIALPGGRNLKVAFVGLIASSTPQQVSASRLNGLAVSGDYVGVIDSLKRTPGYAKAVAGADVRLLLTHIGSRMAGGVPEWDDKDADNLRQLCDPSFAAVLSSHSHQPVCGTINGADGGFYPIVQGYWHGMYVSMIRLTVDTTAAAARVVEVHPELVRVNPKAKLGPKAERLRAQIEEQYATTTFRGHPLCEQLTRSCQTLVHDRNDKYKQTEMGRLVCEAYAEAYRKAACAGDEDVVVGLSHFGSIRGGFAKGAVRVIDVGEALPFSNALKAYTYSGKQLLDLVEYGFHNVKYGHLQTSGLDISLDGKGHVRALVFVTSGGKRIPIKPKGQYTVVADEYITTGGDGYLPEQFPAAQEVKVALPATTDAFMAYLRTLPELH